MLTFVKTLYSLFRVLFRDADSRLDLLPGWGPVRVGAQSGLGPGPGWGPYGPLWAHIWAHMGPYGSSWTGLGEGVNFPSTFRKTIWTNLTRFGFKLTF